MTDESPTTGNGQVDPLERAAGLLQKDLKGAAELAREVLARADANKDHSRAARALNLLADIGRMEGEMESSFELTQQALAKGRMSDDERAQAYSISNLGALAWHRGEFDLAIRWFEEARALGEKLGDEARVATCCSNLSLLHYEKGELKTAVGLQERSLELRRRLGDGNAVAQSYLNLGVVHVDLGDWDRALEDYFRALTEMERDRDQMHMALCHNNIGEVYLSRGKLDRARFHLERALELAEKSGVKWVRVEVLGTLGEAAFATGDMAKAQSLYEQDRALCLETGDREELAETLRRQAELDLANGDLEPARERLDEALDICTKTGSRREEANVRRVLGELLAAAGEPDQATASMQESIGMLRTLGNNYELAGALISLGRHRLSLETGGREELKEALGILRDLGVLDRAREVERLLESEATAQQRPDRLQELARLACAGLGADEFAGRARQLLARILPATNPSIRAGPEPAGGVPGEGVRQFGLEVGGRQYGTLSLVTSESDSGLKPIVDLVALGLAQGRMKPVVEAEAGQDSEFPGIVGADGSLADVFDAVARAAPTRANVLVLGESGTGKELVARAMHRLGPGKDRPFVALNCAAIPENLLESELFGIEKGTATGVEGRQGKLEHAAGGTLFLDEVGDMSAGLQSKLLRVLQERVFERVGGREPINADVRIVAATNRDLKILVAEGDFREDLFYRLNVLPLALPPLRERRQDIPPLARMFLDRVSGEYARPVKGLTEECLSCLMSYDWPGNVRELENVIERAVILARGAFLDVGDLPPELGEGATTDTGWQETRRRAEEVAAGQVERGAVLSALEQSGWVVKRAAEELAISRRQLYRIMDKHGLKRPRKSDK